MKRADPATLRVAMETATMYMKAGIAFACLPVLNAVDHRQLLEDEQRRLDQLITEAEAEDEKS
jgi:hypothetical protein